MNEFTEFIRNTPELIFIAMLLIVVMGFRLSYIGMKYDDAMLKINPQYKGYNFIKIKFFSSVTGIHIPHKRLDYTKNPTVDMYVHKYNSLLKITWTIIAVTFVIWIIQQT